METLLIRLLPETSEQTTPFAEWLVLDSDQIPVGRFQRGELTDATELAKQRRVIVLVPAEETLITTVNIKVRNRSQLLKAIPYALEEEIAEDVEELHFALGNQKSDEEYSVAVVAKSCMDAWLNDLSVANITPRALIPELFALPWADQSWSVLLEDRGAVVRTAEFHGFTVELDNLHSLLSLALDEADSPPESIAVYRCGGNTDSASLEEFPVAMSEHHECPPELMAAHLVEKQAIDLLQGAYQIKDELSRSLRPWRTAAMLLAVWLGVLTTNGIVDYWRLSQEQRTLSVEIERIFRETFPGTQRVVNPRVQMEQRLKALQGARQNDGGVNFFELLDAGGRAISQAAGTRLDDLTYRPGVLEVSLTASDLQAVEGIKQQLQKDGLKAEIQSADTRGQRVDARLLIQRSSG